MSAVHPASYRRLLELANQRAIDGKGGLAASIAKLCLDSHADLTLGELALVFDILRRLIDQVELSVRRYIADFLAERDDVPHDLILFLANDSINVAYPVLVHSVLLNDDDLVAIIDGNDRAHRLAIAKRDRLSESVTDRLVATDDALVILETVRNFAAQFSPEALGMIVDRSLDETALQEPLVHRADLSPTLARRLYVWVGDTLKQHLAAHYPIDQHSLDEMVDRAVEDAFSVEPTLGYTAALPEIEPLSRRAPDWADREPLLVAMERGGMDAMADIYSQQTGLSTSMARTVLDVRTPETVAIACRAIDMRAEDFVTLLLGMMTPQEMLQFQESGKLARITAYFQRIDLGGAGAVLKRWHAQSEMRRRSEGSKGKLWHRDS